MIGAIRSSSLAGLSEMRSMIELLHAGDDETPDPRSSPPRLTELPVVLDAVRAAGAAVHVAIDIDTATCRAWSITRRTGSPRRR